MHDALFAGVKTNATTPPPFVLRDASSTSASMANHPTSAVDALPSFQYQENIKGSFIKNHRQNRGIVLYGSGIRLTWVRVLVACFSYLLLFTDVPRTGLAITNLHKRYTQIEPNIFLSFGPYWYSTAQIHANETTEEDSTYKVWTYKFDTTSIALRAFAEFFKLPTFPDCLLYRSNCKSDFLSSATLFQMLDSLVEVVANRSEQEEANIKVAALSPVAVTLRSKHGWFDQVHHHLLPTLFNKPIWRLNQALHYPVGYSSLLVPLNASLCSMSNPVRPYSCDERWVNFQKGCDDAESMQARCQVKPGYIWTHILERQQTLLSKYPEDQVDLTIIESNEDSAFNRGGLTYYGRRMFDIVTISRVRKCDDDIIANDHCKTIFVQDYRYEGVLFTSDITNWYWVVAVLRCLGQGYMHLRCMTLFLACYKVTPQETESCTSQPKSLLRKSFYPFFKRLHTATSIFFKIPCQIVIYGSWFPLCCYVMAHIIDSPLAYEMVAHKLISTEGVLNITFRDFITIATVRMRNVWLMAFIVHFFTYLASQRPHWVASATGILGVREFSITLISSVTVFAQYRSTQLRRSPVLSVDEVIGGSHGIMALKQFSYRSNGGGNELWEGVWMDVKCIVCVLFGLLMLTAVFHATLAVVGWVYYWLRSDSQHQQRQNAVAVPRKQSTLFLDTTLAPYTAGILWPASALSVAWDRAIAFTPEKRSSVPSFPRINQSWKNKLIAHVVPHKEIVRQKSHCSAYLNGLVIPANKYSSMEKHRIDAPVDFTTTSGILQSQFPMNTSASSSVHENRDLSSFVILQGEHEILQWSLERILERREEVVSFVLLMNLTLLTDIWTFIRLRFFANQEIYWLQSKRTKQIVLMPRAIVDRGLQTNTWVAWDSFDVVSVQSTQEMQWDDLLYCG